MTNQNICSCCSKTMLRHIAKNRAYWFCRSCWQETPLLTAIHNKQQAIKKQRKFLIEKNAPIRISL